MARHHFTLDEANALLAEVAPRMQRALRLHLLVRQGVAELRQRGVRVTTRLLDGTDAPPEEGDVPVLERTRAVYAAMTDEVDAIAAAGAEVKGVAHGLVDFWSWLDGEREVLLCWKIGEPRITHYHPPEAGFAGRAPVTGHAFTKAPTKAPRES